MGDIKSALAYLDKAEPGIVELETLLTAIPALAPESGGDGEWKKAEALEAWLRSKGLTDIEHHDAPDPRVSAGKRPNLVVTIKGKNPGKRVWIMAHTDVVPEGDRSLWDTEPFKAVLKDGKLYGRGVEDNQQGLVSGVFAALALLDNGIQPEHDVKLLLVADEEFGSVYGIQWLLANRQLFQADDLIVVPDGGKADGSEIETAEKNICWLKVATKGKQCHASRPDDGANAFLANCELALELNRMETEVFTDRDPIFDPQRSTITPTKKDANVPNINTVPADDVFYVDMRVLPQYSVDRVLKECQARMDKVAAKYGVKMSYEVVQRNESPATPVDAPVVTLLSKAVEDTYGVKAKAVGIGGGTVGAYLRKAGFPCVVWSRQDETMHAPNEYAKIENIVGDAKVFLRLILAQR
ncbi:MAG: M20 family metallo-hydrolase [Spirochaetales bacterium]|nr:M20 family metallo-hydrolase [Spirochaetales bacterium]MBP7264626.1 M20 family metallo-hydrolase [Spirochaetia bacterium]